MTVCWDHSVAILDGQATPTLSVDDDTHSYNIFSLIWLIGWSKSCHSVCGIQLSLQNLQNQNRDAKTYELMTMFI